MRLGSSGEDSGQPPQHLTYCTNIHPGDGWATVLANLQRYAVPLKARLSPDAPFGIGLRLSGAESRELLADQRLADFQRFLAEHGLYVFTLNGFPYGPFHGQVVKAEVHSPDWRDNERVNYTLRLIEILAALLPPGVEGGISTSPLSYKPWIDQRDPAVWELLTRNVVRVAEALARLRQMQGTLIHLDIEPEPDGLLERSQELVEFFEGWLLPLGGALLADRLALPETEARDLLLDHVRVCWDTCHVAIAYEQPEEVLARYEATGIKIGKVQISSAVQTLLPAASERDAVAEALQPFAESTYLHQVVQRNHDGALVQYRDLRDALPLIHDERAAEWRIHFHVPIFVERYTRFHSTQTEIRRVLALLEERQFCQHLEIETYTWEVLPPALKLELGDSILREYQWVLHACGTT